jgi:long-chain acyl-CoA synthetase
VNLASLIEPHPDDAPALVTPTGDRVTYGELREEVARLRGGLSRVGIVPGDRVAIAAPNNRIFVTSYLAALGAGAVAVPLNPHSPGPEMAQQMGTVGARMVVVGSRETARSVNAIERTATARRAPVDASEPVTATLAEPVSWESLSSGTPVPPFDRSPDDVAALVFTSGTAGAPRAAMLTHGNLLANVEQLRSSDPDQTPDDVVLGALPMFHIYGLNVVLGVALASGHATVLEERFDPQGTLATIQQHHITVVPGVPTMWSAWANLPDADPKAFASVRLATSGAAPLDPDVRRTLRDRFGLSVIEGYGLTEASPAVSTGMGIAAPDGSVGVPLPDVTVRLVDPTTGDDALVGDPGEIWVQGPNVFPGYWDDAEATATALTNDGWLRTGDVATADDNGYLHLVDRAKDLVIVSGFNVFPAEVEEVIEHHAGVSEAAVVGVPDPQTGEAVTAFVVRHDPAASTPDEAEITALCGERLARYKCPTTVTFVAELPHSLTGKVQRRKLQTGS